MAETVKKNYTYCEYDFCKLVSIFCVMTLGAWYTDNIAVYGSVKHLVNDLFYRLAGKSATGIERDHAMC